MHKDISTVPLGSVPRGFAVRESSIAGVVVLFVEDVLDLMTAPQLSEVISAKLAQSPSALIIDLTDVTFLASAGMTTLAKAREHAGTHVRFAIVADGPSTSRPIKLLGLDDTLAVYPTLDEALRHVR